MSLCDDDFFVVIGTAVVLVVAGASTTVETVVVTATVVLVVETAEVLVVVDDVVVAAPLVTVKPVDASSRVLWAWIVALPALAAGGTDTLPENDDCPLESAVPIRVAVPDCTKSMTMQLGLSAAHAR
jgi:hypothetical protein